MQKGADLVTRGWQVTTASGLNILAGLWLIISRFILGYSALRGTMWNDVIVGIIIALIAAGKLSRGRSIQWLSWINVVLGLWLIVSPFIFGNAGNTRVLYNEFIVSIVVVILAAWSALSTRGTRAV
jgi:hypothetical protein